MTAIHRHGHEQFACDIRPCNDFDTATADLGAAHDASASEYSAPPDCDVSTTPCFEVLLVDRMSTQQERRVLQAFHDMRQATDRFVYQVIVAHDFDEALDAVLNRSQIQV